MKFFFVALVLAAVQAQASERLPLFKLYPSLEAKSPRTVIMTGATPVEPLRKLEKELLVEEGKLWVKRDDGSTDPLGGNKARKLEFLIGDARASQAKLLITSGMWGSNHALATAVAAKRFGFKAKLILGPQPITADVRNKLLAMHAQGAEMHHYSGKIGMGIAMLKAKFAGKDAYYIPPGGSNDEGDLGYVNAFLELVQQLGRDNLPERIVVPVGSMGTAAGLLVGSCLAGTFDKVRIDGVGVADPLFTNDIALRKQAIHLHNFIRHRLSDEERKRFPHCKYMSSDDALLYIDSYYDPGYGAATDEVQAAVALFEKVEGLKTEITYSGKALAYMIGDLRTTVAKDRRVPKTLFWLTYNSYDLSKLIGEHQWKNPAEKWRELPSDFHTIFTGRQGN